MITRLCLLGVAALGLAQPALACSIDELSIVRLPHESEAAFRERAKRLGVNETLFIAYRTQLNAFEKAENVWTGRIARSEPWLETPPLPNARRATVSPLSSIKGVLPEGPVILEAFWSGGMCAPGGDGAGALADVGELVVVMSGRGEEADEMSYDSFAASEVVTEELLAGIARLLSPQQ